MKDQERAGSDEMQLKQIRRGGDGVGGERKPRDGEIQSLYETIHSSGQSFWYACDISVLMESSLSQLYCLSASFHKDKWSTQITETLSLK